MDTFAARSLEINQINSRAFCSRDPQKEAEKKKKKKKRQELARLVVMGGSYERLPSEPGSAAAARGGWAALRRAAAAGLARLYAARRRWAARSLARARSPAASKAAASERGYDAASYARNFDDGAWKADEGVLWSAGMIKTTTTTSLAACRIAVTAV